MKSFNKSWIILENSQEQIKSVTTTTTSTTTTTLTTTTSTTSTTTTDISTKYSSVANDKTDFLEDEGLYS